MPMLRYPPLGLLSSLPMVAFSWPGMVPRARHKFASLAACSVPCVCKYPPVTDMEPVIGLGRFGWEGQCNFFHVWGSTTGEASNSGWATTCLSSSLTLAGFHNGRYFPHTASS